MTSPRPTSSPWDLASLTTTPSVIKSPSLGITIGVASVVLLRGLGLAGGYSITPKAASTTISAVGTNSASSGRLYGTGACGALMRTGGASR